MRDARRVLRAIAAGSCCMASLLHTNAFAATPTVRPITQRIIREFTQETGHAPVPLVVPAGWRQAGLAVDGDQLKPSHQLATRFGDFLITVYTHRSGEEGLYGSRDAKDRVWWLFQPADGPSPSSEWMAQRAYGTVVVSWWNTRKNLDARWRGLTAIIEKALEAK